MRTLLQIILLSCLFTLASYAVCHAQDSRAISFDKSWCFRKDTLTGAEQPQYSDKGWRLLNLPHDWSIEDLPNQKEGEVQGPFTQASLGKAATGFTEGGIGWYRKTFTLNDAYKAKKTYILFDGVYMDADVWINGHHLGNHPYGYTSFSYDLTNFLNPIGKANVIAVRAKNIGKNSRWYSGSGIYRHVWLLAVNPVHTKLWGNYITTPEASKEKATVNVQTSVENKSLKQKTVIVKLDLINPSGQVVASQKRPLTVQADSSADLTQKLMVINPKLWGLDNPVLYKARVTLTTDNRTVDQTITPFGIRTIHFDVKTGFTLNGQTVKLRGGCIHHDNGPLGAAAIDRAEERKIELLKEQGYNAIRLSHNPPSPALLDACDKLGMLVIDEAFDMWEEKKTPQDYHLDFDHWSDRDISSMVLRDRNHPGIIMWSIGNEIPEVVDSSGYVIGKRLSEIVHKLDPTRPVTMAIPLFAPMGKRGKSWDSTAPSFANLDVGGYNYASSKYESDHEKYPGRVMFASEYFPTKGIDNWLLVEKLNYVIGTFSWTAMDYLGEAGLGAPRVLKEGDKTAATNLFLGPSWPIFGSYTGELDLIGDKKVNSYYLDVVWKRCPVEMLVHAPIQDGYKEVDFYYNFPLQLKSWSFPGSEGKTMQVYIYSRAQKVTLELNGKVIGEQLLTPDNITAKFDVHYEAGTLIAKSYTDGIQTGADTLKTVGKPFAVRLKADRKIIKAHENDLSYVKVEVVDDKGNVVPYVDDLPVNFRVEGNGEIAGVANGNPADMSSFQQPRKRVYHGKALVIVRPLGRMGAATLSASAKGLQGSSVQIQIK